LSAAATVSSPRKPALRFDRNEWSGAFGDLGTDLPLLVGVILAARMDPAGALILFGAMQILTGVLYRMPMAVQPLKAMAALVIAQKLPAATLLGGGLAIGLTMLLLSLSGLIEWIARAVPKPVVRGIQLGLGLQLAGIALREYMRADGKAGLALAAAGFVVTVALMGRRRIPAAVVLVLMGAAYAFAFRLGPEVLAHAAGFSLPRLHVPSWSEIWAGFLLLALPQIPLSIANSVLATRQIVEDLFPERRLTARRIGLTYSAMNLINPFFGGVPTCHGSGGLAGHYAFGGRTGGSVVIYGSLYLILGFFFSRGFDQVIRVFPMPVLGVLLLFEGLTMAALVRDLGNDRPSFLIAVLVGLVAVYLPYGYVIGLLVGAVLATLSRRGWVGL
jgi:xanthine/uracil permease